MLDIIIKNKSLIFDNLLKINPGKKSICRYEIKIYPIII